MGKSRILSILAALFLLLFLFPLYSFAFHDGGVGECAGCHSMHNSYEGFANITGMPQYQAGPFLLKAQDPSGVCLNCHQSNDITPTGYHISTASVYPLDGTTPVEMTPGGDFAWLKKTMTGFVNGTATTWEGDRHGHNIVAMDFGYNQDKTLTIAPGGTYPSASLACSSCHDPHGKYRRYANGTKNSTGLPIFNSGSYTSSLPPITGISAVGVYRLLGGIGYQPKWLAGSLAFMYDPPDAVSPSSYNGVNTTIAGTFDLVAYGQGMSEWCNNCHVSMHTDPYTSSPTGQAHPAGNGGKLSASVASNYSAYISSGNITGIGANYSALAPFELGTGSTLVDYVNLVAFQATQTPPTTTNNVSCLSCHRAHASAFASMTRYSLGSNFMTVADFSGTAIYDTSMTENKINLSYNTIQQTNGYNGRPATVFGAYARKYCNKCHVTN